MTVMKINIKLNQSSPVILKAFLIQKIDWNFFSVIIESDKNLIDFLSCKINTPVQISKH